MGIGVDAPLQRLRRLRQRLQKHRRGVLAFRLVIIILKACDDGFFGVAPHFLDFHVQRVRDLGFEHRFDFARQPVLRVREERRDDALDRKFSETTKTSFMLLFRTTGLRFASHLLDSKKAKTFELLAPPR